MQKVIFSLFVCIMLCGCYSTRATDRQILEYQRQVDRLEEELRARDRAIATSIDRLEAITDRSTEMGTDIDSIIRELDEYQRAIESIIYDYKQVGNESKTLSKTEP